MPGTLLHIYAQLNAEIARLRECLTEPVAQAEAAAAHARMMAKQNQDLQKSLNSKSKKQDGKKKLTTDACLLTSDEYVTMRRKEMEDEEQETRRATEKAHLDEMDQEKRQQNRVETAHTVVWNVGWCNRKKEDLKDLCYALGVSTDGTRNMMVDLVEAYLAAHPLLANDYCSCALYLPRVTGKERSQVTTT